MLSADGSVLAASINACTLALVDAGIPMPGLLSACTVGMSGTCSTPKDKRHNEFDPLMDLSLPEEQELPFLTLATTPWIPVGENSMESEKNDESEEPDTKVAVLNMDSKVHYDYLDNLIGTGKGGCNIIRDQLEQTIRPGRM